MMITEMHIMLGGQVFLVANSDLLCKSLHLTIGKVCPRGAKYIGLVLEALLQEYPVWSTPSTSKRYFADNASIVCAELCKRQPVRTGSSHHIVSQCIGAHIVCVASDFGLSPSYHC